MTQLRPITDAEYAAWEEQAIAAYAQEKVRSGAWMPTEALALAEQEHKQLLPAGPDTPDHRLYTVLDEAGVAVGMLWIGIKDRAGQPIAYLYNIEINASHRRQGHARRALAALEVEVCRLGLAGIALHVFGHNTQAQTLYNSLGYVTTNINMFKSWA